jgi:hypothetical protein
VTDFPCLCRGRGGFTRLLAVLCGITAESSSSSDIERSYDVRGVSFDMVSTMDCRLNDDVSVLLLLSANVRATVLLEGCA